MSWILSALDEWAELTKVQEGLAEASASRLRVEGVIEPVQGLIAAWVARACGVPVLLISPTGEAAQRRYEDLLALIDQQPGGGQQIQVALLPSQEALLYEDVVPDPSVIGERLSALDGLARGERGVYVASAPAAFQRTLAPDMLRGACFSLAVGEEIDRDSLVTRLVEAGYEHESMVDGPGQISVRGGVIDLYPSDASSPVRLELFGDEIESLRTFDPASQRSAEAVERVIILPAREVLLTEDAVARGLPVIEAALERHAENLRSEGKESEAGRLQERVGDIIQALRQRAYTAGLEYFLPAFHPEPVTSLDYLPEGGIVVLDEPGRIAERYQQFQAELLEIQLSRVDHGLLLPLPGPLHMTVEQAEKALGGRRTLELCLIGSGPQRRRARSIPVSCQPMEEFGGDVERVGQELRRWQRDSWRLLIATRQADRLIEMLDEAGVGGLVRESPGVTPRGGQIVLSDRPLAAGFRLPGARLAALTDHEIFGWRKITRPSRRRAAARGAPISAITDLHVSDYVVHINHGIGIYRGLVRRGANGAEREYLLVEYADQDRLYVPVDQFDRVQRYLGGEEERPAIHRLGGSDWERAKSRARRSAQQLAGELVRLYAAREGAPGHAFAPDTPWQREMEDGFPYEETPDQLAAIEEVKRDMETPKPMDRLVCGDVGYGKTEVAIRAAFKTVMDGRQAAVLVPTTVLAQQHYNTFRERLTPYPVRVELLSRFRSRKEQASVVADLAAGAVDIVVGTHRLLSGDIAFKNLGLVVVDEEQRFGVRHKEKLKQLRTTVDVLTMTATPIPRTLHMALSGIRDMSLINDPPEGRTAIITRALEREDGIIREAILRELERGGQVYFVHNRVESIGHVAEHVHRLVPQARVAVGHGQMNERQLESAMLDFYAGDAQILVSTTIVENGLDIPNVNTLIVSDADRLGLAQLYQLRGRVGRSNRQAYAYLMWTPFKRLTEAAEKRIAAVREFSELGSGYKVALRDLEIRGAGNLLGPEQHGFLASVGFELYMQMLADAVQEAKGEAPAERPQVSVDLPVDAFLPEDYAPDLNQRIELYRRLAGAPDERRLDEMEAEIVDRFGRPLPAPARNLIRLARLKVRCAQAGVESIATEGNLASLRLADDRLLSARQAPRLRQGLDPKVRIWIALISHDRVIVSLRKADAPEMFFRLEHTLDQLAQLPLREEARRRERRSSLVAGK
jgi:transcription-repair coupling factor (superfamily II helicase)